MLPKCSRMQLAAEAQRARVRIHLLSGCVPDEWWGMADSALIRGLLGLEVSGDGGEHNMEHEYSTSCNRLSARAHVGQVCAFLLWKLGQGWNKY